MPDAGATTIRNPSDNEVHAELPQANTTTAAAAIRDAWHAWRTNGLARYASHEVARALRRRVDLVNADVAYVAPLEAACPTRPLHNAADGNARFTSEAPRSFTQCAGKPGGDMVSTWFDNPGMPVAEPDSVVDALDIDRLAHTVTRAINCYAGQVCVAASRLTVKRLIAQASIERIAARCAALWSVAIRYGIATLPPIVSTVRAVPVFGPRCAKACTPTTVLRLKEPLTSSLVVQTFDEKECAWHSRRKSPAVALRAYTTHLSYAPCKVSRQARSGLTVIAASQISPSPMAAITNREGSGPARRRAQPAPQKCADRFCCGALLVHPARLGCAPHAMPQMPSETAAFPRRAPQFRITQASVRA